MQNIQPGDEVAFLRDNLRGKVKSLLDKGRVLIVLEDGFEIPAYPNELALTRKHPENVGQSAPAPVAPSPVGKEAAKSAHSPGLYLGFSIESSKLADPTVHLHLLNNTNQSILYGLFRLTNEGCIGVGKGEMPAYGSYKAGQFTLTKSEGWRLLHLQALRYGERSKDAPTPLVVNIPIKDANLLKKDQDFPLIARKGYLLNLEDLARKATEVQVPGAILLRPDDDGGLVRVERVGDIIDLHLEALVPEPANVSSAESLEIQFSHFRNSLEKAHAFGLSRIIFIHGVGGGTLKKRIREHLEGIAYVKEVRDAEPRKFGYGATEVIL